MNDYALAEARIQELIEEANETDNYDNLAEDIMAVITRYYNHSDEVLYLIDYFWDAGSYDFIPEVLCSIFSNYPPVDGYLEILESLVEEGVICNGNDSSPVTLYRGVNNANRDIEDAYSFTTNYDIAKKFALGQVTADGINRHNIQNSKIYTVQVPAKFIFGHTDERQESESFVLPVNAGGKIDIIKVEELN